MISASEAITAPARSRSLLLLLVKVSVSAGLLYALLSRTDLARLGREMRAASIAWLAASLALYFLMIASSAWRWKLLLDAQRVTVSGARLVSSYLVATFFNNFLPSNIGGDVIRVRDTASAAGSRTLATTIVLVDRMIGLMGLVFIAALGATFAASAGPVSAALLWAGLGVAAALAVPAVMAPNGLGRLLGPLRVVHPEWVGNRIERVTGALGRFRQQPGALLGCFLGAVVVQAILVAFYAAIARGMAIPIALAHLAVIVPVSFVAQMLPISINGFGVREAAFSFYFARVGLPLEQALLLSFAGAGLIMLFSLSGAAVYVMRSS